MDHSVRRRPSPPVALPRPVPKLGPFEIDRKSEPFDVYNDVGSPHPFAAKPLILAALNCGINDGSSFCGAQVFRVRREPGRFRAPGVPGVEAAAHDAEVQVNVRPAERKPLRCLAGQVPHRIHGERPREKSGARVGGA